jgi:hypothetical protein
MSWVVTIIMGFFTVTALDFDDGHWNLLLTNCNPDRGCIEHSYKISAYLDQKNGLAEGDVVYIKSKAECQYIKELERDEAPRDAWICNAETLEITK